MPIYDLKCKSCNNEFEVICHHKVVQDNHCAECGGECDIQIGLQGKPQVLEYWDESLNAHITGPAQKARVMSKLGVESIGRVT